MTFVAAVTLVAVGAPIIGSAILTFVFFVILVEIVRVCRRILDTTRETNALLRYLVEISRDDNPDGDQRAEELSCKASNDH